MTNGNWEERRQGKKHRLKYYMHRVNSQEADYLLGNHLHPQMGILV